MKVQLLFSFSFTAPSVLKITILIGGSPCQDLSRIKSKDGKGLNGEKSKLFYEYARLVKEVQPDYFFLENVLMNQESEDIITNILGTKPFLINSSSVSAQDRQRLYWTNLPFENHLTEPCDTMFSDIQELDVDEKFYLTKDSFEKEPVLNKRLAGNLVKHTKEGKRRYTDTTSRVYNPNYKMATLTAISGGGQHKKVFDKERKLARKLTPLEYERLQNVPDGYTAGVSDTARYKMLGNGWTVDVIAAFFKTLKTT